MEPLIMILRHWVRPDWFICTTLVAHVKIPAKSLSEKPRETAVHVAFVALDYLPEGVKPTVDNLKEQVVRLLGKDVEIGEDIENSIGEL